MKKICRYSLIALPLMLAVPIVSAQSVVDPAIGFGTAQAPSSSLGLDNLTLQYCQLGTAATCQKTPKLGSFFMGFGANFMLWDHFGIGMEAKLQPGKQDYGQWILQGIPYAVQTRTILYDFNGIWKPWSAKRADLELAGGFGGANIRSSVSIQGCGSGSLIGCSNTSSALGSSNHLQLHAGVGVKINLTESVFLRPQVDVHWIRNFTQFGRDTVPSYMVWLGYSFGSH